MFSDIIQHCINTRIRIYMRNGFQYNNALVKYVGKDYVAIEGSDGKVDVLRLDAISTVTVPASKV